MYDIELKEDFGHRRSGDGIVVYLYYTELDYEAVKEVVSHVYYTEDNKVENEDGEEDYDWSEYDPSSIYTKTVGDIDDEITMEGVKVSGETKQIDKDKFSRLLKEIFSELEYPLVFIDTENKEVYKIDDQKEIDDLMSKREDYGIYIREYDCLNDY